MGGGALADIGSHALATAEFLLGPISRVMGDCVTAIPERPDRKGARRAVEVDDVRTGLFALREWRDGGSRSELDRDRPKDAARLRDLWDQRRAPFSQERFRAAFLLKCRCGGPNGLPQDRGWPRQPPYGRFCVAPGHQLGFNDLKAIEVAGYLDAIAGRRSEPFNFRMGLRVQTLVETIQKSSQAAGWFDVKNG
jgi:predicted dehydrogenase